MKGAEQLSRPGTIGKMAGRRKGVKKSRGISARKGFGRGPIGPVQTEIRMRRNFLRSWKRKKKKNSQGLGGKTGSSDIVGKDKESRGFDTVY